jgi:hypothetical protein
MLVEQSKARIQKSSYEDDISILGIEILENRDDLSSSSDDAGKAGAHPFSRSLQQDTLQ